MVALKDLSSSEQIGVSIETDNTLIFEEIARELEVYLWRESGDADSTDVAFDFLTSLTDQVQREFE